MKTFLKMMLIIVGSFMMFSCVVRTKHVHHVVLGQAKKIMKSKSAKPYAPGQVKKIKSKKPPKHHRKPHKRHKH